MIESTLLRFLVIGAVPGLGALFAPAVVCAQGAGHSAAGGTIPAQGPAGPPGASGEPGAGAAASNPAPGRPGAPPAGSPPADGPPLDAPANAPPTAGAAAVPPSPAPGPPAPLQPATPPAVAPSPPPPAPPGAAHELRTRAVVHLGSDYPRATLELRSLVDEGPWQPACVAPCDLELFVDGMEARITAPGMRPSNTFRIEAGSGVARLKVSGGSRVARDVGLTLLIAGLPVTFGGVAAFGYGSVKEEPALRTTGIVAIAVGAVASLVALPLLVTGSTSVRNEVGKSIARTEPARVAF